MWATSVPVLVFLGLSVLELGPMYATDRQTDVRQKHRLIPPPIRGGGIITSKTSNYATTREMLMYFVFCILWLGT